MKRTPPLLASCNPWVAHCGCREYAWSWHPGTELNPAHFTYAKNSWDMNIFSAIHSEATRATSMKKWFCLLWADQKSKYLFYQRNQEGECKMIRDVIVISQVANVTVQAGIYVWKCKTKNPTVCAAGTLQWAPTDTMEDFRWHCNNALHKIYIQFYVQFTHFVMMMFLNDWDIY